MRFLCLAVTLACPAVLLAADPLEAVIDRHVDAKLKAESVAPAPQADDYTLVRRLTLDLVGRIPTTQETDAFVQAKEADKRAKLVDRLMASPGYARYQAYLFEVMLNDGKSGGGLRDYLTRAVAANKPWDQIFRDLLLPDDADAAKKGASDYLKPKLTDVDKLTSDVSVAFFGVNVSCAQCHDHPNVKDWTQDHFYGMKSFLARTYDAGGGVIAERPSGLVKFKPTRGAERQAKLMFLTGATVDSDTVRELNKDEQKKQKEMEEQAKKDKKAPPPPAFSARAELVKVALQPKEAEFFSKNIVNRLWHRFFGVGLVTPLDQMHSANRPSHPELLKELAADIAANGYDLKRLVRGIVMSRAYSRGSKYTSESHPDSSLFAVAQLRALTPMQLATSLKIAGTDPKQFDGVKPDELEKRLEQMESAARGFAGSIAVPTDNFQIGVSEALLFSNGDRVLKEFLTDGNGTLLGRVKAEKDATAAHMLLVRTALARPAAEAELKAFEQYAARRPDRPAEAQKQMLWALMTCPEFRFNH